MTNSTGHLSAVGRIAQARGCVGPYPCGAGAGGNGDDLPCACENAIIKAHRYSGRPGSRKDWDDVADIVFAAMSEMPEFEEKAADA